MKAKIQKRTVGWREWVALPELGLPAIKAKIDTGARTSAIHAHAVRVFRLRGKRWVRFRIYPLQRRTRPEISCSARVTDERLVTDSGGRREKRLVIQTQLEAGGKRIPVEITLTRRDSMQFRMLLGRTALARRFTVDPQASYLLGRDLGTAYRRKKPASGNFNGRKPRSKR